MYYGWRTCCDDLQCISEDVNFSNSSTSLFIQDNYLNNIIQVGYYFVF